MKQGAFPATPSLYPILAQSMDTMWHEDLLIQHLGLKRKVGKRGEFHKFRWHLAVGRPWEQQHVDSLRCNVVQTRHPPSLRVLPVFSA